MQEFIGVANLCVQFIGEHLACPLGKVLYGRLPDPKDFCVLKQEAGLQSYIRPVVQAIKPAGPDGIRRRGSHLNIEREALMPYRSVPVPVRPDWPITRVVACSP